MVWEATEYIRNLLEIRKKPSVRTVFSYILTNDFNEHDSETTGSERAQ